MKGRKDSTIGRCCVRDLKKVKIISIVRDTLKLKLKLAQTFVTDFILLVNMRSSFKLNKLLPVSLSTSKLIEGGEAVEKHCSRKVKVDGRWKGENRNSRGCELGVLDVFVRLGER